MAGMMTDRDDIIRMARAAGFEFTSEGRLILRGADWHTEECVQNSIERFAALAEDATKRSIDEDIAKLAGHRTVPPWVMKLVRDAVEIEREACEKICVEEFDAENPYIGQGKACAAAIRARGEK